MKRKVHAVLARTIAAILGAAGLALGAATPAAAAPPYATTASVNSIQFTESEVVSGREARLAGSWSLPDNPSAPAGFVVDLPSGLQGLTDSFTLDAPGGETMGTCVVTATQVVCDIDSTYIAENPLGLSGTFEFWANVTTSVRENTATTYDFGDVTAVVTVTPSPDLCTENCAFPGRDTIKEGFYNRDANQIDWYIKPAVPASGMAGGQLVTIVDILGPQQLILNEAPAVIEVMATNEIVTSELGSQSPGNWHPLPSADLTISPDNTTVSFTTRQGFYYELHIVTQVLDGGTLGTYGNSAEVTVGGDEPVEINATVVRQGGGGTGIGESVGRFAITKSVNGPAALVEDLTYTGSYTITLPDSTTQNGTFSVANGATWTSPDFPRDSTVQLIENDPAAPPSISWIGHTFSVNNFALLGGTQTDVTLTNESELATGAFEASKVITGGAAGLVPDDATFTLLYSYPEGPGFPAGSGSLELPASGETVSSPPLPVTASVTLTELTPPVYPGFTWGTATISPATFTIDSTETATSTVTNDTVLPAVPHAPAPTAAPAAVVPPAAGSLATTGGSKMAIPASAGLLLVLAGAALRRARRNPSAP
ncbi:MULTISPECIES: DUF5979 domain-containing protein [unclassified Microbacterium]|uniref:DUF5979 domain-containing protein n=1 Tax=unclassified Microbacterium TaxID=2609290 RepID=UPI0011B06924|nr:MULTISPECIES: DUF5979 domain-containing protein [unclassified Microbacterium]